MPQPESRLLLLGGCPVYQSSDADPTYREVLKIGIPL